MAPARIIAVVLLLACTAFGQSYHPGQEPRIVQPGEVDRATATKMAPVCRITMTDGTGSGTLIAVRDGVGLVLSCRHVCEEEGLILALSWMTGEVTTGVVAHVVPDLDYDDDDFDTDLALIVCYAPKGIRPAGVGTFDPRLAPFTGVGWRAGQLRVAHCRVAEQQANGLIITPSGPYIPGMSGGALFDRRGRVVAVVVGMSGPRRNLYDTGIAVDGPQLQQLLRQFAQ